MTAVSIPSYPWQQSPWHQLRYKRKYNYYNYTGNTAGHANIPSLNRFNEITKSVELRASTPYTQPGHVGHVLRLRSTYIIKIIIMELEIRRTVVSLALMKLRINIYIHVYVVPPSPSLFLSLITCGTTVYYSSLWQFLLQL